MPAWPAQPPCREDRRRVRRAPTSGRRTARDRPCAPRVDGIVRQSARVQRCLPSSAGAGALSPPQLRHRHPHAGARGAAVPCHRPAPLGPAQGRHRRRRDAARGGVARDGRGDEPGVRPRHAGRSRPLRIHGEKDLHLFAVVTEPVDPQSLSCHSHFLERGSTRMLPEMDGFGWFAFDRVAELCTARMAEVLQRHVDLDAILGTGTGARPTASPHDRRSGRGRRGGQRDNASRSPKPTMNRPASRVTARPIRGSARSRSASECVSRTTISP